MSRFRGSLPVGLVLLAALTGWALLFTPDAPETETNAAAYLLVAGGLIAGWVLNRLDRSVAGLVVLMAAVTAYAATAPDSMSGNPLAPPLGYMNANGALLLCGAAGAVLATGGRRLPWRAAAAAVALAVSGVCWSNDAQAASLGAGLLAVWVLVRDIGPGLPWVLVGVTALALPSVLTVAWGGGWIPRPQALVDVLSEERFDLWQEAYAQTAAHPISGVGPGGFSQQSPTASDPDLEWAHSYWLQTGAELGLVGLGLLLLLLAWGVLALGRYSFVLGVMLLPASVDYVLHFGGVLLGLSVVVGGALGASGAGKPWFTPPSP